jgi:hypothetical protein
MYCVVVWVVSGNSNGALSIFYSAEYFVDSVTSEVLSNLKTQALDVAGATTTETFAVIQGIFKL